MLKLRDAMEKYNESSSIEKIIKGLQSGGFSEGLNPTVEAPIFQKYLITLLNSKTNKELAISLNNFKDVIKEFSNSSSESSRILNLWTKILAFATVALVFTTLVTILVAVFKN